MKQQIARKHPVRCCVVLGRFLISNNLRYKRLKMNEEGMMFLAKGSIAFSQENEVKRQCHYRFHPPPPPPPPILGSITTLRRPLWSYYFSYLNFTTPFWANITHHVVSFLKQTKSAEDLANTLISMLEEMQEGNKDLEDHHMSLILQVHLLNAFTI